MSSNLNSEWEALLAADRPREAIDLLEEEARVGNAQALFRLAALYLIGSVVRRDLQRARNLLRDAVQIGHVDAALLEVALTANGSGGPASWLAAKALLDEAALGDPLAVAQRELLAGMELTVDGRPARSYTSTVLSKSPHVRHFKRLFTSVECDHVARITADLLEPAAVVDPVTGRSRPHPIRTSEAAVVGPAREDLVVRALNQRIATVSATDINQGEPLTILRYKPGQQYRAHLDTIAQTRNQRVYTVIVYLNDGFSGGETVFANIGLKVKPSVGDAILFSNTLVGGAPDPASQHAGLPVGQGVKWIATRWIRARAFNPWTGPETA